MCSGTQFLRECTHLTHCTRVQHELNNDQLAKMSKSLTHGDSALEKIMMTLFMKLIRRAPPVLGPENCQGTTVYIDLFENSVWQASFRGIIQAMPHRISV